MAEQVGHGARRFGARRHRRPRHLVGRLFPTKAPPWRRSMTSSTQQARSIRNFFTARRASSPTRSPTATSALSREHRGPEGEPAGGKADRPALDPIAHPRRDESARGLCTPGGVASRRRRAVGTQHHLHLYGLNALKPRDDRRGQPNARRSAEQFARDSGASVGRIKTASQGYFSVGARDGEAATIAARRAAARRSRRFGS